MQAQGIHEEAVLTKRCLEGPLVDVLALVAISHKLRDRLQN